jgi:hypothetical protein
MRYGQALQALRLEPQVREYVWDGEFRHELGATVQAPGTCTLCSHFVFSRVRSNPRCVGITHEQEVGR